MSLIKPANGLQNPAGQIVRYGLEGPFPSMVATVAVAEAFRGAVLSAFHATSKAKASFLLSGHYKDGRPDSEHRHAYYLPRPDKSGRIRELLVVSPQDRFSEAELIALKSVKALRWNGPSARTTLELLDTDDESSSRLASHWVSLTPYVPIRRFWGTPGKHHLTPDKQISAEITRAGYECVIEEIKFKQWSDVRVRVAPASRTHLPGAPTRRTAYRVEFRSRHPICGPIALGHSCHFGLGLFVPATDA